jgi:hypothetical protein
MEPKYCRPVRSIAAIGSLASRNPAGIGGACVRQVAPPSVDA